jgi:hypothetical protein
LDASLDAIGELPKRELQARFRELKENLDQVVEYYGFNGTLADIERILPHSVESAVKAGHYRNVTKRDLARLFTRYERALPIFPRLPMHARIAVDVLGIRRSKDTAEWFLLEAALFEDMAVLWNAYKDAAVNLGRTSETVAEAKRRQALLRSTVKAMFNLVEGYINGLGCDVLLIRDVPDGERKKLAETDPATGKSSPLSLRDKLLQYPKIAKRTKHPPLTESDCAELAFILDAERTFRHALIHPTPRLAARHHPVPRELVFLQLAPQDVELLIDSAIGLINKIAASVGPEYGDPSLWVFQRQDDGRFPEDTLK